MFECLTVRSSVRLETVLTVRGLNIFRRCMQAFKCKAKTKQSTAIFDLKINFINFFCIKNYKTSNYNLFLK